MANYIDKKELLAEMIKSKQQGKLTNRVVVMFMRMIREISRGFSYKHKEDREDCNSQAMEDILRYWKRFNPEHPKANVFSFFTQMIKNGIGKGFHKIRPDKMKGVISLSKDDIFINI